MESAGVRLEGWRVGAAGAVGTLALLRVSSKLIQQRRERDWAERLVRQLELERSIPPVPQSRTSIRRDAAHRAHAPTQAKRTARTRGPAGAGHVSGAGGAPKTVKPGTIDLAWIAAETRRQHEASARRRARAAPRRSGGSAGRLRVMAAIGLAAIAALLIGLTVSGASHSSRAFAAARSFPRSASPFARRDIPVAYIKLYVRAARHYHLDWATLAAVGQIESNHGRNRFPGVRSGRNRAGAAGPTQFLAATWARYGVDANGDGSISPYDPADAITAEAAYLRASGAPERWLQALLAYNHSHSYVISVLALSRRYEKTRVG